MAKKRAVNKTSRKAAAVAPVASRNSPKLLTPAGSQQSSSSSARWTFLTNHSHVLVMLDSDEAPVLREVALEVGITERAVQRIIQDLEEGGFIERERVGRRNRYRVLRDQHLRHPIESHRTIGDLLNLISSHS
ncbi:MAG: ArsR family transcriptional regulator [Rhodopirellula sp.]|nr:ArsR family transcriptional regulator [Rhodopirellula sp.]